MRIRIRAPDGGESVFVVDESCKVESLRHKIQWCIDNKDWSHLNPIKVEVTKHNSPSIAKAPDEMWTLNDPLNDYSCSSCPDNFEELNDFESAMSNSHEVHECERKTIELLYGTQVLEVNSFHFRNLHLIPLHRSSDPFWWLQDGCALNTYGITDGSLIHPLYGWRDGSAGSDAVSRLLRVVPWQETEWYASAVASSTSAAASFMHAQLGSLGATRALQEEAIQFEASQPSVPGGRTRGATDMQEELWNI